MIIDQSSNWEFRGVLNPDQVQVEDQRMTEKQSQGQQKGRIGLSEGLEGGSPFGPQQPSPSSKMQSPFDHQRPRFGTAPLEQWFQPNLHPPDGGHGTCLGGENMCTKSGME